MAIATNSLLTSTAVSSPTTTTTASVTNTNNALQLLSICVGDTGGAPAVPTSVTGLSLTWVLVASATIGNVLQAVYRALGGSSTGALTITWAAGTDAGIYQLDEFTGVESGGAGGQYAVVQFGTSAANTSTPTVTLASVPRATSAIYAAVNHNDTVQTAGAGSGFTLIGTGATITGPSQHQGVEWNNSGGAGTGVTFSWSGAGNAPMIALEIGIPGYKTISAAGGNWSTTSSWVEGIVPTSSDNVVALSTSGALTIDTAASCRSIDLTNYTSTLTHNTGITLSIGDASGGAMKFVAGMTYTKGSNSTSAIAFVSTSNNGGTGWPITTGGKNLGNTSFSGVGGKWVLQDTFTANAGAAATMTLSAGTLDLNNQAVNHSGFTISGSPTLSMGSSTITANGSFVFNISSTPTLTSNTATINATGGTQQINLGVNQIYDFTGLTLNITTSQAFFFAGNGSPSLATLTYTAPAQKYIEFMIPANKTLTVTGTLTLTGNSAVNRLLVGSATAGLATTISAATLVTSNTDWIDTIAAGAASWDLHAITGGAGDCGGNSGITFTTAVTRFAVAAGNFSSTATWSTTSGGSGGASVPLPQDSAVFNASTPTGTYTEDMIRIPDLNCTGFAGTINITTLSFGAPYMFCGSITLSAAMTWSLNQATQWVGRGSETVTCAGKTFGSGSVAVSCGVGTYTHQDAFTITNQFTLTSGGWNTNNQTISIQNFSAFNSNTRTMTLGTSTINLTSISAGTIWNQLSTNMTFSGASSTIVIANSSANSRQFSVDNVQFGALTYTVAGSAGALTVSASTAYAFIALNIGTGVAMTLTLPASQTLTIGTWNVNGTSGNIVTVNTTSSGFQAPIHIPYQQTCQYVSFKDTAFSGAWVYDDPGGVNVSNNKNIVFGPAPPFEADPNLPAIPSRTALMRAAAY